MFAKLDKKTKAEIMRVGGWREKDILKNKSCVTKSKDGRYLKIHKKPPEKGYIGASFTYDTKSHRIVG